MEIIFFAFVLLNVFRFDPVSSFQLSSARSWNGSLKGSCYSQPFLLHETSIHRGWFLSFTWLNSATNAIIRPQRDRPNGKAEWKARYREGLIFDFTEEWAGRDLSESGGSATGKLSRELIRDCQQILLTVASRLNGDGDRNLSGVSIVTFPPSVTGLRNGVAAEKILLASATWFSNEEEEGIMFPTDLRVTIRRAQKWRTFAPIKL